MGDVEQDNAERGDGENNKADKLFTLKKWNAVAMWSWDVECDTCAICRVQVMGESRVHNLSSYFFFSSFYLSMI
jgi:RING-box protein 2